MIDKCLKLFNKDYADLKITSDIKETVICKFKDVCGEFESYIRKLDLPTSSNSSSSSSGGDSIEKKYIIILTDFIKLLKNYYKFETTFVLVKSNRYDVSSWGNIYWSFFHLASILIYDIYVKEKKLIFNFGLLVYNIDCILPCPECKLHYLQIKNNAEFINILELISFGHSIEGVYKFHNEISKNIVKLRLAKIGLAEHILEKSKHEFYENVNFSYLNFIDLYNCYPIMSSQLNGLKFKTFQNLIEISWQTTLHKSIVLIIQLHYKNRFSFIEISNYLKLFYKKFFHSTTNAIIDIATVKNIKIHLNSQHEEEKKQEEISFEDFCKIFDEENLEKILNFFIENYNKNNKNNSSNKVLNEIKNAIETINENCK